MKIIRCARCGGDHDIQDIRQFERPFAPPEAKPLRWTHWAACPASGDPILFIIADEAALEDTTAVSTAQLHLPGLPEDRARSGKVDEMDCSEPTRTRAQQLYERYTANSDNLNFRGEQCPAWPMLTPAVRSHWCAVALLVEDEIRHMRRRLAELESIL